MKCDEGHTMPLPHWHIIIIHRRRQCMG